nr:4-coumarate--CoA ligase-like 9 [Tanacetum cinerariifolium]
MLKAVERFKVMYMSVLSSLVVAMAKSEVVMRYDLISDEPVHVMLKAVKRLKVTYMSVSSSLVVAMAKSEVVLRNDLSSDEPVHAVKKCSIIRKLFSGDRRCGG